MIAVKAFSASHSSAPPTHSASSNGNQRQPKNCSLPAYAEDKQLN
jgi:hypothetical protein